MKLKNLSIKNFRSITEAKKIRLNDLTVIVGKNNEGKSNILKGINIALGILSSPYFMTHRKRLETEYEWKRDFPVQLQDKKRIIKKTIFELEFEFEDNEIKEFKDTIKSNLNGLLPIRISIGEDSKYEIEIVKNGRGHKTLNLKKNKIIEFISEHIQINYIPAIRTGEHVSDIIAKMLQKELMYLEKNESYINALKIIEALQDEQLQKLSKKLKEPLSKFIPSISSLAIKMPDERRRIGLRMGCEVYINDGYLTDIEYKGDGIKSLVALSLLHDREKTGSSIIAIEEPEAHLHPGAMHALCSVIQKLSLTNQIILSTHSPLFINRDSIESNIIIEGGSVKSAKKIDNIRKTLGIKSSDNLQGANFVLVVEGEDDKISLKKILSSISEKLKKLIDDHLLVIESLGGAGNLPYKLTGIQGSLCKYHVFFDHDPAANTSIADSITEGLLQLNQYTQTICGGMDESEFEDCINQLIYKDLLLSKYGIDISHSSFSGRDKWSKRISRTFASQGVSFSESIKAELKADIANLIKLSPIGEILNPHKSNSITALIDKLERQVQE
ncbi:AAA family ATPase [Candidatus Gracilibacteria bacterium]|nr:AAA family ATPase [Candidatus Gracilibacteria bacterium]